ncbi:hypothetical protein Droror1_Dr00020275 [Drosera rotundifolia]
MYSPSRAAITKAALPISDHQQRTPLGRAMGFVGEEIARQRVFDGLLERDVGHAKGAVWLASVDAGHQAHGRETIRRPGSEPTRLGRGFVGLSGELVSPPPYSLSQAAIITNVFPLSSRHNHGCVTHLRLPAADSSWPSYGFRRGGDCRAARVLWVAGEGRWACEGSRAVGLLRTPGSTPGMKPTAGQRSAGRAASQQGRGEASWAMPGSSWCAHMPGSAGCSFPSTAIIFKRKGKGYFFTKQAGML